MPSRVDVEDVQGDGTLSARGQVDESRIGGFITADFLTNALQTRWRWDLNPRTGYPVTHFRVLRTRVQPRSPASVSCSTRLSVAVAEPARTTTNETKTETRRLRVESETGGRTMQANR